MNTTSRYVKSYVTLMRSPIWKDSSLFMLYHYCLYKASRNTFSWRGRTLYPGEFPISKLGAARELNWSKNKLKRKLEALEATGMISVEVHGRGTLIRLEDNQWTESFCLPANYQRPDGTDVQSEMIDGSIADPNGTVWVQSVPINSSIMNPQSQAWVQNGPVQKPVRVQNRTI